MNNTADEKTPLLLLVDDNAVIAMNHKMILQKNGFELILVFSGEEAVETVKNTPAVSLVLMDIDLEAGIDGVEATRRILAIRDVPVVFLTNHSERAFVKKVKQITNYGYVLKNAGEFVLLETVNMAFTLFDAKRAVEREKEKYKRVVESTEEAIITYDFEGRVLLMNSKASSILGGGPGDFIGKHISELLPPLNAARGLKAIRSVFTSGQSERMTSEMMLDGSQRWFETRYQPVRDEHGRITAALQLSLEITAQIKAEQELRQMENQYRLVAENSSDVIYVLDSELKFSYLSPSAEKLFGYSFASFRDKSLFDLMDRIIHREDLEQVKAQVATRLADEPKQSLGDFRVYTAQGQLRWVEARAAYVYGEKGQLRSIVGIIRDITRRKNAEIAVQKNSVIFELFEEFPSVAVVKVNARLQAEYVSPSMQQILGYPPDYFLHRSVMEVVHPEDRPRLEAEIGSTIEGKLESLFSEYRVYTSAGEVRWMETRARLSYNRHGEFDGAVYIQSDVTERKVKEIELEKAIEENRHLMAELNHRVKNNLAMVSSLINLKDSAIGSAADLSDIRNQVRAISFIHEKLQNAEDVTHIDIQPYIEDLLDSILSFEPDNGFVLNTTVDSVSLPTKIVMNIGLILNELALNALKHAFSDEKQAMLTVRFEKDASRNRYIFSVSNSGNTFPETVNPAKSDSLGLQLVATIARQMKASMVFSTHPETQFTFLIPASACEN